MTWIIYLSVAVALLIAAAIVAGINDESAVLAVASFVVWLWPIILPIAIFALPFWGIYTLAVRVGKR